MKPDTVVLSLEFTSQGGLDDDVLRDVESMRVKLLTLLGQNSKVVSQLLRRVGQDLSGADASQNSIEIRLPLPSSIDAPSKEHIRAVLHDGIISLVESRYCGFGVVGEILMSISSCIIESRSMRIEDVSKCFGDDSWIVCGSDDDQSIDWGLLRFDRDSAWRDGCRRAQEVLEQTAAWGELLDLRALESDRDWYFNVAVLKLLPQLIDRLRDIPFIQGSALDDPVFFADWACPGIDSYRKVRYHTERILGIKVSEDTILSMIRRSGWECGPVFIEELVRSIGNRIDGQHLETKRLWWETLINDENGVLRELGKLSSVDQEMRFSTARARPDGVNGNRVNAILHRFVEEGIVDCLEKDRKAQWKLNAMVLNNYCEQRESRCRELDRLYQK